MSGDERLPDTERDVVRDLGSHIDQIDEPAALAADLSQAPVAWTTCPACGHSREQHRPNDRLPGAPWLCGCPVDGTFEARCGCDGNPVNDGQTTRRLYARLALLFGSETAFEWWVSHNTDAGTRPIDLLRLGRLDDLTEVVAAAETKASG